MSHPFSMPQNFKVLIGAAPAADAAGRTATYITCKNAHKVTVICQLTQGNAATVTFTLFQAKNVAALNEKALTNNVAIYANLDAATSDALVRATDGVAYTTDAALKNKIVIFEVDPASMDVNNGFDCLTVKSGASNAANITSIMYAIGPLRYPALSPISAIVD